MNCSNLNLLFCFSDKFSFILKVFVFFSMISVFLLCQLATSEILVVEENFSSENTFQEKFITSKDYFSNSNYHVVSFENAAPAYKEVEHKFITLNPSISSAINNENTPLFVSPAGDNGAYGANVQESHLNTNSQIAVIGATKSNFSRLSSQIGSTVLFTADADNTTASTKAVASALDQLQENHSQETREQLYARLVLTSKMPDPTHPATTKNKYNLLYNPVYGFGHIDFSQADSYSFEGKLTLKNYSQSIELNESLNYATTANTVNFTIENSGVNAITFLTFYFTSNKLYFADCHVRIISPSGTASDVFLGSAEAGNLPPVDQTTYEENQFSFSTRAFYGEQADGTWQVQISHSGFIPLSYLINPVLSFSGFAEQLPPHSQTQGTQRPQLTITDSTKQQSVTCNVPFDFSGSTDENYYLTEDFGSSYRRMQLTDYNGQNLTIPCLYKDKKQFNITDSSGNVLSTLTVSNPHTFPMVIERNKYNAVYTSSPVATFKYVRQDEHISPLEDHSFANVVIYDLHKRHLRYIGNHKDTGSITLNFTGVSEFLRAVITISPNQIVDNCDIALLPFRYFESGLAYPFSVYVSEEKCKFSNLGIQIDKTERLKPIDYDAMGVFLQGLLIPFTTVFATLISSVIWYFAVERRKVEEPAGELAISFVP